MESSSEAAGNYLKKRRYHEAATFIGYPPVNTNVRASAVQCMCSAGCAGYWERLGAVIRMVNVEPFHKNLGDMLVAAERCIQLRQHLPALVLIYTLIDSLAWAAAGDIQSKVRKRFESWVSTWLLPELVPFAPAVTATDVYAARCGVLHTLTGDSELSSAGHARRFVYAWGTAKTAVLEAVIRKATPTIHVALHYDDLHTALVRATARFLERANNDPALSARLELAAAKHYTNIDAPSASRERGA